MPLGIQDIYRVPQNIAATERAREQSGRAERQTSMNIAVQRQGLEAKQATAEVEKEQKKAEMAYSKLNFANRMLSTVKDDESLTRAKEQYLRIYPEDRENVDRIMPGKYSKNFVDMAKTEIRAMADTLKPLTISEGQKVIDPVTMEELASGGAKAKDEFGEPYIDKATGALMQKNIGTGKINKIAAPPKGMVIESDGAGGFTMRTGVSTGAGLTKPVVTKLQKEVVTLKEDLQQVRKLGGEYNREYLTYSGRGKKWALNEASRLGFDIGEENKEFVAGARQFQETIEQAFNAYRKRITGAQAALKEIEMLRTSILNKKLSPDEFEASLDHFITKIEDGLELREQLLTEGFSGKALGKEFDRRISTSKTIDDRGDELSAKGMSDEEVINTLKAEGYF